MAINLLQIKNLHVKTHDKKILNGIDLKVKKGELHAIMGPNGSGKSTLAFSVMGHPNYKIIKGEVIFKGKKLNNLSPDKRAKLGMFLGFQHPLPLEGIDMFNLMQAGYQAQNKKQNFIELKNQISKIFKKLNLGEKLEERSLNQDFSGGEKKKAELAQLELIRPKLAILDEIDTGLDINALKLVAKNIAKMRADMGIILITHYNRILKHLKPDFVHVMIEGRIVQSGDYKLAEEIEQKGYGKF